MRIDGLWYLCDDGMVRPVIRGELESADGTWVYAPFLVDTGADRTVISAEILDALQLRPIDSLDRLGGVGGIAESVVVEREFASPTTNPVKPCSEASSPVSPIPQPSI